MEDADVSNVVEDGVVVVLLVVSVSWSVMILFELVVFVLVFVL
jgi:hypothetical protein